jgi:hypothetical protein
MNRSAACLLGLVTISCGGFQNNGSTPEERDVSGNYALTYDNQLKIKLNVAGAVREVTQTGYGGVVDFGMVNGNPTTLDLTAFCAKPEVQCPSEAFWSKVAITQPDLHANNLDLQKLVVVNDTNHALDAGIRAPSLSGLVDHNQDDKFILGLGAEGGSNANCVALSVSLAGGRFSRVGERYETTMEPRTMAGRVCSLDAGVPDAGNSNDAGTTDGGADGGSDGGVPPGYLPDGGIDCTLQPVTRLVIPNGAKVDGIKEGKVFLGWAGGCAFGPILAGATLTFETGYTGTRTGNYDPPPFTPAPIVLPDAGTEDAGADAGP